jgi:hypothetical protein
VLAEVMERARASAEVRGARRPASERAKPVNRAVFLGLGSLFGVILVWNIWLLRRPLPELPPEEREVVRGVALFAAAQRIEAFRVENGRLPAGLDELGLEDAGLIYTVVEDRYRLDEEGAALSEGHRDEEDPIAILESLGLPVRREDGGG